MGTTTGLAWVVALAAMGCGSKRAEDERISPKSPSRMRPSGRAPGGGARERRSAPTCAADLHLATLQDPDGISRPRMALTATLPSECLEGNVAVISVRSSEPLLFETPMDCRFESQGEYPLLCRAHLEDMLHPGGRVLLYLEHPPTRKGADIAARMEVFRDPLSTQAPARGDTGGW